MKPHSCRHTLRIGGVSAVDGGEIAVHRTKIAGAPRSTKMGTIHLLFPYDAAACYALQSVSLRNLAILHYAARAVPSIVRRGSQLKQPRLLTRIVAICAA